MGGRPVVPEQFRDAIDRMRGDSRQHVLEPGKGLYSGPLAGSHETPQDRRRFAALAAAKEDPIATADRDAAFSEYAMLACMPDELLARVREQAERSVRAAALLRIARVETKLDQEKARHTFQQALEAAPGLSTGMARRLSTRRGS